MINFRNEKQFDLEYLVEGFELDSLLSLCMSLCMYFWEMEWYDKNGAVEWLVWPWYEG